MFFNRISLIKNKIALSLFVAFYICLYTPIVCANQPEKAPDNAPLAYNPYTTLAGLHLPSINQQIADDDKEDKELAAKNEEYAQNIFKFLQIKLPPVRETAKLRITYNLFGSYFASHPTNNASVVNTNTLNDLEAFCGYTGNLEKHIFKQIDLTKTTAGKIQLQRMLLEPLNNIDHLNHRQAIIKTLASDETLLNALDKQLKNISVAEQDFFWFWKNLESGLAQHVNATCFPGFLDFLNKTPFALQLWNLFRTVTLPLAPLGATIFFASQRDGVKRITRGSTAGIDFAIGVYTLLTFFQIYASVHMQKLTNDVHGKMNGVADFSNATIQLASIIQNHATLKNLLPVQNILKTVAHPSTNETEQLIELLKTSTFETSPTMFSYQGRVLTAFKLMTRIKDSFLKSLMTVGQLDAYVSIAQLYRKYAHHPSAKFCFPDFIKADKPYAKIDKFWLPSLNPDKVITNNMELGKPGDVRSMIVTGPNAGGKSTALKGITLAILLAQAFGISCCQSITLTPFAKINTYMNIADTAGSASLFQAEMRRTSGLIKMIKELSPGEFAFIIMDEIFTGTNAKEGQAGAYGVAKKLSSFDNTLCIFATHFKALTELEKATHGIVKNNKVSVIKNSDGSFTFPYKLEYGITDQAIALDLLQQEGFDADILNAAHEIMNNTRVNPTA